MVHHGIAALVPAAAVKMLPSVFTASTAVMCSLPGCVLDWEGCCYLANSTSLMTSCRQRREALQQQQDEEECSEGEQNAGSSSDSLLPPAFIHLVGSNLAPAAPKELPGLLQQLQTLEDVLASRLGGCSVNDESEEQQQEQQWSAGRRGRRAANCSEGTGWPVLVLDDVQGVPCMPTLNGWLLGYPVVYWVRDYDEAGAASRALSCCVLKRYSLFVRGISRSPGLGAIDSGSRSSSSAVSKVVESRASPYRGMTGGEVEQDSKWLLLAFTIPAGLEPLGWGVQLARLVMQMESACNNVDGLVAGQVVNSPCSAECRLTQKPGGPSMVWVVDDVGPQAVSL